MFFLFCCIALLIENFLILITIRCSPLFHQPTYYFLCHSPQSSSLDICYTSSITPKFIGDLLVERKPFPMVIGCCRSFPSISLE